MASIVSGPGREVGVEQAGAIVEVDLPDAHDVEHREEAELDARAGLFVGLADAPCSTVSPSSMKPAGKVHRPWRGSMLRRHSSTWSSQTGTVPTTLSGFS